MTGQGHKGAGPGRFSIRGIAMRVSMDSLGFHAPRTDIRFSRLSLCVVVCLGSPLCLSSVLLQIGWSLCHPALWRLTSVAWE